MRTGLTNTLKFEACSGGELLLDLLNRNSSKINADCGGAGTCGKCRVRMIKGNASPLHPCELEHLNKREVDEGVRLACQCNVSGEVQFNIPETHAEMRIQEKGYSFDFQFNPAVMKKLIALNPSENESLYKSLEKQFHTAIPDPLGITRAISASSIGEDTIGNGCNEFTVVIINDILAGIEEGDTRRHCYGIAVDIGTTTVVAELVDLNSGESLSTASMINPQFRYGSDVLSRIHYTEEEPSNTFRLSHLIQQGINELVKDLCRNSEIKREHCYVAMIAGNTVMIHLFFGINPQSLGKYPYRPVFLESLQVRASDVNITASPFAVLKSLPGLSGFVGADISAGLLALDLADTDENLLFIDMGTNGEIAVCFNGRIITTSTAAGPALEGMNILCGMKASAGAIDHAWIADGEICWSTIGDAEPAGFCGSGLLDMIAALIDCDVVQKSGRITGSSILKTGEIAVINNSRAFLFKKGSSAGDSGIYLSQQDIRQVQLAKGAIAAGIKLLLSYAGLTVTGIQKVYLAGGFGFYMKAGTLVTLGLIPEEWEDRLVYAGNTSLAGARLSITSSESMIRNMEMLRKAEFLDLTASSDFNRVFAESMMFIKTGK